MSADRDGEATGARAPEPGAVSGTPVPIQPDGWPRPRGYAHAMVAHGRMLFIAGQIGWDPVAEQIVETDFAAQTRRALDNIATLLRAAGAEPHHVTRLTWYITDLDAYRRARPAIGPVFRALFDGHYPAMSVVQVAALLEPGALVEIEATAVLPE